MPPSLCALCKASVISDRANVVGACGPCMSQQIREGSEWVQFLTDRFFPHTPLAGEVFEVEHMVEAKEGRWLAARWVGSTLVEKRCCFARLFDTEGEARQALA